MAHAHLGNGIMERFAEAISELGTVDKPAKLEGRQMLMFLSPKGAK
jgi:translation initiation factor IF-3